MLGNKRADSLSSAFFEPLYFDKEGTPLRRRFRGLGKKVVTLAGLSSMMLSAHNVIVNQTIAEHASSSVQEVLPPRSAEGNQRSIFMFDGFGTINARSLAESLGPDVQHQLDGTVVSVRYGNAILNVASIANEIELFMKSHHQTTIDLVGYSAGGDIVAEVNSQLEQDSIDTEALYFISTPDGLDGLRPNMQNTGVIAARAVSTVPALEYSDPVRFGVEMAARSQLYTNQPDIISGIGAAVSTGSNILDQLSTKEEIPGSWLLVDQMFAVQNVDFRSRFDEIGHTKPEYRRPVVVYLGTGKDGYDSVVDDKYSARHIAKDAVAAGLGVVVDYVPDAIHAQYELTANQYHRTFQKIGQRVQGLIQQEDDRLALLQTDNVVALNSNDSKVQ